MYLVLALVAVAPAAYAAAGYGTSSISVSSSSVSILIGGSAAVNYTVNLASGNTWGTTLVVANQGQLSSQGITTSMSDASGDPPFSGVLTIIVAPSASGGPYPIILTATGDDPSTSNATITVSLTLQATNITNKTTVASTTTTYTTAGYGNGTSPYSGSYSMQMIELAIAIVVMLIIAAFLMIKMSSMWSKLIIFGVLLILIGTGVWLYGDYVAYGSAAYIWGGVVAILLGTIIWIYADFKGGMFMMKK